MKRMTISLNIVLLGIFALTLCLNVKVVSAAPAAVSQPVGYILPFEGNWRYTQTPHNNYAVDLAPQKKQACTQSVKASEYNKDAWIVAAKGGIVIRSEKAWVEIDHGDGYITQYIHVATADRIAKNTVVTRGQHIGHPSCETQWNEISSGVHLHFTIKKKGGSYIDFRGWSFSGWKLNSSSQFVSYNGKSIVYPSLDVSKQTFTRSLDRFSNSAPYVPTALSTGLINTKLSMYWKNSNYLNDPEGDSVTFYAEIYGGSAKLNTGWISISPSSSKGLWVVSFSSLNLWAYSYNYDRIRKCGYNIKWHVKARDKYGLESAWSPDNVVTLLPCR
jgi:hypothetical protein